MRSYWSSLDPCFIMTDALISKEDTHRDTRRRRPCDTGNRDGSDEACKPQNTTDGQQHQRGMNDFSLSLENEPALTTP